MTSKFLCIAYVFINRLILLLHILQLHYLHILHEVYIFLIVATFMYFNKLVPTVVVFLTWGVGTVPSGRIKNLKDVDK